jgi:hypothetical protein
MRAHPPGLCGFRKLVKPRSAAGLLSAKSAPDKWMTMFVPISRGGFNCLLNLRASSTSRAASFRERAGYSIAAFSTSVDVRSWIAIGLLLNRREFYIRLGGCAIKPEANSSSFSQRFPERRPVSYNDDSRNEFISTRTECACD